MMNSKMRQARGLLCLFILFSIMSWVSTKHVMASAMLTVAPGEIAITPALLKNPPVFTGSGFESSEMVAVEMILPPGVTVKGIAEGENVGVAFGTADEKGDFEAKMGAVTILNSLFQVGWNPNLTPNFKEAKPIPPGTYTVIATGMVSGLVGKNTLTILAPPPKKE